MKKLLLVFALLVTARLCFGQGWVDFITGIARVGTNNAAITSGFIASYNGAYNSSLPGGLLEF